MPDGRRSCRTSGHFHSQPWIEIVREEGQRTKRCRFWMSHRDIAHFSELLSEMQPDLVWQCRHPSPDRLLVHKFTALSKALTCGGGRHTQQAFTDFELGSMLLNARPSRIELAGFNEAHELLPDSIVTDYGELAVRWNTADGDARQQALMQSQVKAVFSILIKATLPAKVHTLAGHPVRGCRIGADMLDQVRAGGWFLKINGPITRLA